MNRLILLDNTVLTNLALISRTDLLSRLWPEDACTTSAAMNEYQAGAKKGKFPANAWKDLPLIQLTEQEAAWAKGLPPKLGVGERSCLAVALHRRGLFASDDLDARGVAKQNGIALTGTLGILILCIERSYLTMAEGNEYLRKLIDAGFRSPVRALDSFLKH